MSADCSNFEEWKLLVRENPDQVIDQFLTRLEELTPESYRAMIAAHPDREHLSDALQTALSLESAPLSGVPYVLQDLFDVKDLPTLCGAPFPETFEAELESSSLLYQKMNTLGGFFVAKSVPAEFGVDPRGTNPHFGDCPHADSLRYVCGGGAGASVRMVAKGWAPLAFGIDTCGGIRIPAAFHGLFGFRMATNDLARDGVFPIVPSIESVGWVNAHLDDLLATFNAFHRVPIMVETKKPRGFILHEIAPSLNLELKAGIMNFSRYLDIDDNPSVRVRLLEAFAQADQALSVIESRELHSIHKYWIEEYEELYAPGLLRRIKAGGDCETAEAEKSTAVQQLVRACFTEFFMDYDFLVLPIATTATPLKSEWNQVIENDLLHLCAPASLAFLPAIILPLHCADGRHSAVQIIINPRRLNIVPQILEQVSALYKPAN